MTANFQKFKKIRLLKIIKGKLQWRSAIWPQEPKKADYDHLKMIVTPNDQILICFGTMTLVIVITTNVARNSKFSNYMSNLEQNVT